MLTRQESLLSQNTKRGCAPCAVRRCSKMNICCAPWNLKRKRGQSQEYDKSKYMAANIALGVTE